MKLREGHERLKEKKRIAIQRMHFSISRSKNFWEKILRYDIHAAKCKSEVMIASYLDEASEILDSVKGKPQIVSERKRLAIELAALMLREAREHDDSARKSDPRATFSPHARSGGQSLYDGDDR